MNFIQQSFQYAIEHAKLCNPSRYVKDSDVDRVFAISSSLCLPCHHAEPLFANLWFEGEIACLFGDTNIGKSVLAHQIAQQIAHQGRRVAYFDFENNTHITFQRYYDTQRCEINPSDNFIPIEVTALGTYPPRDAKTILDGIECKFVRLATPVIIIDDIFHICSLNDCSTTDFVLRTFRHWTQTYRVAILVVAHARRHRDDTPININHLTGSQRLTYAFDSIFALNRTLVDNDTFYIKHLKTRNGRIQLDARNVGVLRLVKQDDDSPLHFVSDNNASTRDERLLLNICNPANAEEKHQRAVELHNMGWTIREIGDYFNISHTSARRLLNQPQPQPQPHTPPSPSKNVQVLRDKVSYQESQAPSDTKNTPKHHIVSHHSPSSLTTQHHTPSHLNHNAKAMLKNVKTWNIRNSRKTWKTRNTRNTRKIRKTRTHRKI
ncbi:MAG: hypothetical protein IKR25_00360 [Muribaculaceae bacterium]|nr:hypothetical protein [Muribaculaceae bacterium]